MESLWDFVKGRIIKIKDHEVQGYVGNDELLLVIKYTPKEKDLYMQMCSQSNEEQIKAMYRNNIRKVVTEELFKSIFTDFFEGTTPEPNHTMHKLFLMAWIAKKTSTYKEQMKINA